jgi:Bacterial Ig-like domain (group 3)
MRLRLLPLLVLSSICAAAPAWGQHTTASFTQTVNQRGTILQLSVNPASSVDVGTNVTFTGLLSTAGAPVVTSENVTFSDGTTTLGSAPLTVVTTTNLLPFSKDLTQWTPVALGGAAAPTVTKTGTGPDGQNTAMVLAFPSTASGSTSGISYAVPGTPYAGLPLTFTVITDASSTGTLTLQLTDSPQTAVLQSLPCTVSVGLNTCSLTYTMPANAGTGFAVSILSNNAAAQSVTVVGTQVEQAVKAGPYVQTVGAAASGQGGLATFSTPALLAGNHVLGASYGGDANFIASTSQPENLMVGKGTAAVTLTADSGTTMFGSNVTFTATVTGPETTPTGTVTFMDGSATLGTGTLANGTATYTTNALVGGSHSITAVYSGDTNFNGVTSTALTHAVTPIAATMAVASSENPATYGDTVTLTITMTGVNGVVPTGTVTVMDGTTSLGTLTLAANGTATLQSSALNAGTHNLSITYSGDSNYN